MDQADFIKMYTLQPKEGHVDDLLAALRALSTSLSALDACAGCIFLGDQESPSTVVFIERWRSLAEYQSASSLIDSSLFAPFGSLLATKPQILELQELPLAR